MEDMKQSCKVIVLLLRILDHALPPSQRGPGARGNRTLCGLQQKAPFVWGLPNPPSPFMEPCYPLPCDFGNPKDCQWLPEVGTLQTIMIFSH